MEKQLKDEINKALENIEDIWILHQYIVLLLICRKMI